MPSHPALLGSESISGVSQGPPVCTHLLAKMHSSEEAMGRLDITFFDLQGASAHVCIVGNVS